MRKLKTVLLVVALTFSSALFANANLDDRKTDSDVVTENIAKLLKNPNFIVEKEIVAQVTLTLNKNNEMVVLSVDSEDKYVADFIKSRLNYNELTTKVNGLDKTFIVPVRITPEE